MDGEDTVNPDFSHYLAHGATKEEPIPVLVMLSGYLIGRKFAIEKERHTIGRGDDVDFLLRDESVSRIHAELVKKGGHVTISDLKSQNGIYVNNCKVDQCFLKDGDTVRLGNCIFLFVQSRDKKVIQFGNVRIAT